MKKWIKYYDRLISTFLLMGGFVTCTYAADDVEKIYVGSQICKSCHEAEYESFQKYSKKAGSFSSIMIMKKGLTQTELQTCYGCHTTGYGKPGGFISEEKTPHLKNAGCEVCHGPGSLHAKTGDMESIKGALSVHDCEKCHSNEKVKAFRYKPLVHGGAH